MRGIERGLPSARTKPLHERQTIMANRDDVLTDAMIATEKEIAAGAWGEDDTGEPGDPSGDRTLESQGEGLEGQHEPDDDTDDAEADGAEGDDASEDGEGDGEAEPEGDRKGKAAEAEGDKKPAAQAAKPAEPEIPARVPGHRLREATERATKAEQERDDLRKRVGEADTKHSADIAALRAQVETLTGLLQQRQAQPGKVDEAAKPAEDEMPEVLENPKGFAEYIVKSVQKALGGVTSQVADQRLETSFAIAHELHGEAFESAYAAIQKLDPKNPDDRATVQRIRNAANPGKALVSWHKRNLALAEVGDDPAAYRERLTKETRVSLMKDPDFRKQLLAELRAEAETANDGKPRTEMRLPRNLNGAAGRGAGREVVHLDGSEQGVADAAWQ